LRNDLIARGLKAADQMSVMKLVNPYFKRNPGVSVVAIKPAQVRSWCGTYLASFYGDTHLYEVVSKIVRKTISVQGVRFMIAKQGDSVVGALATYESDGLLGAYCVGTVPRMRGRGVASTMLDHAHRYARRRKKTLIL
jgi:predicted GNAT family acetyltransferase